MQILTDIREYKPDPRRPLFLGIGNFDGLHLGHQALLARVLSEARAHRGIPAILTFRTHPQHVLHPDQKPSLLMPPDYKRILLERSGIDLCFEIEFTPAFSQIDAVAFVRDWLCAKLQVREVCMGYNARFGQGRKGDGALMALVSREMGFAFCRIPPVHAAGSSVSSSRIRELVRNGKLAEAGACLGRPYSLMAEVIPGAGRGKDLGFPTANLKDTGTVLPPCGVYTAWSRILPSGPWLKSVLNLGFRPTFNENIAKPSLEVFILTHSGDDIYGKSLEVIFGDYLRPEKAFPDAASLARQIQKDAAKARKSLGTGPKAWTCPDLEG